MIIIGSGSRYWTTAIPIRKVIHQIKAEFPEFMYYHGAQRGFDHISAHELGRLGHKDIKPFEADWYNLGKAAGMIRNRQMLAEALLHELPQNILLVAMPLPQSVGTFGMINICRQAHINVRVYDSHGVQIDA